ncbi:signal peptidase II [Ileibacterium valens]|uniref:signal peptidase II n=1 Tax=Ileibacterium valens TaxID=1862668 RepID=UPI0035180419
MKNVLLKKKWPMLVSSLLLIVLLVGLDQWTKAAVTKAIPLHENIVMIPGFFDLTNVRNTGAAFSMFAGMGMGFFIVLTIGAILAMIYYFIHTDDLRIEWCLALITAGAIGNLIDRATLGYVRDFFQFYIFGWPFAVFNIADVCVSVGFVLLVVFMIMDEWKEKREHAGLQQ